MLLATNAIAQPPIAADQTLAQPSVVDYEPNLNRYRITQGTAQGGNLFHSFERFSIPAGSEAIFYFNRFEIANIFARVTGSSLSDIQGLLGIDADFSSEVGSPPTNNYVQVPGERELERSRSGAFSAGVDLFLINPNGIIFGENAAINVGGAFVATTASGIQFGDSSFSAESPESPAALLAIAPSAYFFNHTPQAIVSRSGRSVGGSNFLGLRAYNGEDITFLGGDITIDGGGVGAGLNAFAGRIELGTLAAPGTVSISDGSLVFADDLALGTVQLINNARLDVSLHEDGEILITAHDINILDRSALLAGISQRLGSSDSQAGNIRLNASGTFWLDQGRIANDVAPGGIGNSGNIILNTGSLQVTNGGQVSASSFGTGNSGNVLITAADGVTLQGLGQSPARSSAIFTRVESGATGSGGDVVVNARDLKLLDGGQISASTLGFGDSGDIIINARESVTLASAATNGAFNGDIFTSVGLNPEETASQDGTDASRDRPVGNGGDISMTTGRLRVADGASLTAATFGDGNAGNIFVTVTDSVVFEGTSADGRFASQASTEVGAGANGSGGNIAIRAGGAVDILGNAAGPQPGLFASTAGTGNAGNISVVADQLKLHNGQISTASVATAGGAIALAANQIQLTGDSDIQTNVAIGAGRGGDITLSGQYVFAFDDSDILASARDGRGGNITLNVRGYFGEGFTLNSLTANPSTLEGNDRPDINASGAVSGVVTIPDISFISNSLANLPEAAVPFERILAGSCIARTRRDQSTFVVTGSGGLPIQPGDRFLSAYPTGDVQILPDAAPYAQWQPGDDIVEPSGVFALADGRLVLSRECNG